MFYPDLSQTVVPIFADYFILYEEGVLMSTRERLDSRVSRLTEKQLEVLIAFLDMTFPEEKRQSSNDADEVDELCGIFHDAADPDLIPLEKNAWAEAAAENERKFWEDLNSENT